MFRGLAFSPVRRSGHSSHTSLMWAVWWTTPPWKTLLSTLLRAHGRRARIRTGRAHTVAARAYGCRARTRHSALHSTQDHARETTRPY
eukprot:870358-Pleurochrysis_carterae.AAC.5